MYSVKVPLRALVESTSCFGTAGRLGAYLAGREPVKFIDLFPISSFPISRTRTVGHPRRPRPVCTGVAGRPDLTVLPLAGVARLGGGAPSFFR